MDKIQVYFYKFIEKTIMLFPYKFRYKIADFFGIVFYYLIKKRREITIKNIKIVFPDLKEKEVKRLAKKSFQNIAKNFFELIWSDKIYERGNIHFKGMEHLDKYKGNTGVIILSMHTGNWEMGAFLGKKGYNLYNVVREQKNKFFDKLINDIREQNGGKSIYAKKRSLNLIKALKRKGMLALISDQRVKDVEVDFFNHRTYAPNGVAVLALKYNVPVVMVYVIRNSDNSHTIIADKEIELKNTGNFEQDVIDNTQNFVNEFERVIKKYPEQWFWQHNRWR